ncbi:unnamed protein product [Paramecium sonneborni]|uniref:Sperm-tail PG-rich repeat protein n=1 Tax=Paramecium sonneborni TaxID=65129 RepID=A0A8S1P6K1_9CILI|nr:unnamed protein product [Paramecium sonneborni]
MAFVYRSEIKSTYIPKTEKVGPGQYDQSSDQEFKPNLYPFNSTVEKCLQKQNQQTKGPGPGAYNLQGSFETQKVIFQSDEQEIKILEMPKPISVFRSSTLRFKEEQQQGPGPNYYFQEERRKFYSASQKNPKPKLNVMEQLVNENKYISIPSIPSNIHQGYVENSESQLEQKNGVNQSYEVGPGSYDFKSVFSNKKPRGVSWHKSNKKQQSINTENNIGPGQYDIISNCQPMYQMKPTTSFSSKLNRYSDFKFRNAKNNNGVIKKGLDNKSQSFHLSTNSGTTARDTDQESEYSYIEDATPGPGYYENASTQQTISQYLKKSQIKGSIRARTKRFLLNQNHIPGPGSYQVDVIQQKQQGPQPPFLIARKRFDEKLSESPPPGNYKVIDTMEQRLISKLVKAPLGQFGSNEDRFKNSNIEQPGPGTYDIMDEEIKNNKKKKFKGTSSFLSHVPKIQELLIPDMYPSPVAYHVDQHTIERKIVKTEEDNPKLAVIKPPFGVAEERWKIKEEIEEDDDDEPIFMNKSQINSINLYKKKKKDQPPFLIKVQKSQLEQKNGVNQSYEVGPGSYDFKSVFSNKKPRGVSWHKSNKKQQSINTENNIGPGQYDIISNCQPMYQMKPTTSFSSKLNRYSDFKFRNAKNNNGVIKKGLDNKSQSFHLSTNSGTTARDTDQESEYSYIEDATPGPGYYENASTQQTISQYLKKSQIKGSIRARTKRFLLNQNHIPGPGSYQVDVIQQKQQGPQPPFLIARKRFDEKLSESPPPGNYKVIDTMEQRLISKLVKAPLGQFGSNEDRFKNSNIEQPGPGTYDIMDEEIKNNKKKKFKGTSSFLSHVPKIQELLIPDMYPSPVAYHVDQHTIERKIVKTEEDNPKLAVIKPPFGVAEERWKIKEEIEEDDDDEPIFMNKSQINSINLYKKKKKDQPPFLIKKERFVQSDQKNVQPGPSDYADGTFPNWNKRTFNIIFADI